MLENQVKFKQVVKIFIVSHTIFLESMNQRLEKTDKDMLCREA